MPTVKVIIELNESCSEVSYRRAIKVMQERDRCFPSMLAGDNLWRLADAHARGRLAHCLSQHGLSGRLSVEEKDIRWTGFTAAKGVRASHAKD